MVPKDTNAKEDALLALKSTLQGILDQYQNGRNHVAGFGGHHDLHGERPAGAWAVFVIKGTPEHVELLTIAVTAAIDIAMPGPATRKDFVDPKDLVVPDAEDPS